MVYTSTKAQASRLLYNTAVRPTWEPYDWLAALALVIWTP